ncbi:thymidylate synthase [Sphingopyxis sp. CCNWLW253]
MVRAQRLPQPHKPRIAIRAKYLLTGKAFNVFEAALLTRMVAEQAGLHAHELVWTGGDVHLYLNHAELVEQQLSRVPDGAPKLRILRQPSSIFDYRFEDFAVEDYAPQAHISAPVAV